MQNTSINMRVFDKLFAAIRGRERNKTQAADKSSTEQKECVKSQFHTLDTITLADFISVYLGNVKKVVRTGNASKQAMHDVAAQLVNEYSEIVGGTGAAAELAQRDRLVRLEMRIVALHAAMSLCDAGDTDGARKVLQAMAIKVSEKDDVKRKASSYLGRDMIQRDLLAKAIEAKAGKEEKVDRAYFTRERVAIMRATKLHIDPYVYTAAEYAYLVQSVTKEVEQANTEAKKKKR